MRRASPPPLPQASVTPAVTRQRMAMEEREKAKGRNAAATKDEKDMANKWIERLATDTEQAVDDALGNVNKVATTSYSRGCLLV